MNEFTVAIIKPDGFRKGPDVRNAILQRYRDEALKIYHIRDMRLDKNMAEAFYHEHWGKFFFDGLVLAMTSGYCTALILSGEDAIQKVRTLNGATDPAKAAPGTIRHDFRSAGGPFNTVHGSDSEEAAKREVIILFGPDYIPN